jgi:RimJ/RimL family protein N-acetyltransferase
MALDNTHWRKAAATIGRGLVDGRGVLRVANALLGDAIALRPAREEDMELVYRWRNDETTRRYSFDPRPVPWETHVAWYTRSLQRDDRILLMGELQGNPIGVLRYDFDGSQATISVYVAPDTQHQGLGRRLIRRGSQWLSDHRPAIRAVTAEIMAENVASQRAFLAAGYTPLVVTLQDILRPQAATERDDLQPTPLSNGDNTPNG